MVLTDGNKTLSIRPQGRFKADNATALAAAAIAGLIAWLCVSRSSPAHDR